MSVVGELKISLNHSNSSLKNLEFFQFSPIKIHIKIEQLNFDTQHIKVFDTSKNQSFHTPRND